MLYPNHLQTKEKIICIYLIPAGCNLYYQAVQRLNGTSTKFEETLRLRTILSRYISNTRIILINDNSTLFWHGRICFKSTLGRKAPTNFLKTSELVKWLIMYAFFPPTSLFHRKKVFIFSCTKRTWLIPKVVSHSSMQSVVVVIRVASEKADWENPPNRKINELSPASWSVFWSTKHCLISWSVRAGCLKVCQGMHASSQNKYPCLPLLL